MINTQEETKLQNRAKYWKENPNELNTITEKYQCQKCNRFVSGMFLFQRGFIKMCSHCYSGERNEEDTRFNNGDFNRKNGTSWIKD